MHIFCRTTYNINTKMGACATEPQYYTTMYQLPCGTHQRHHACHATVHKKKYRIADSDMNVIYEGRCQQKNRRLIPHGRRGILYIYNTQNPGQSYNITCRWVSGRPIGLCVAHYLINHAPHSTFTISDAGHYIGEHCEYYASGSLKSRVVHDHDGRCIGPYTTYYSTGKKQFEGQRDAQGRFHGDQYTYDSDGHVVQRCTFIHGIQQEIQWQEDPVISRELLQT